MITDFVIVRHGETSYNEKRIIQGWMDTPLNENGYQQAMATARALQNEHFDEAWFSDLQRAAETARKILEFHPETPRFSNMYLREWRLGILQNMSHAEIEAAIPEYETMLQDESIDIPIPSGESRSEFAKRVGTVFQELADRSPGKRLLVVTHGGVLGRLYRYIGADLLGEGKLPPTGNASVCRISYDHDTKQWTAFSWNETFAVQIDEKKNAPAL